MYINLYYFICILLFIFLMCKFYFVLLINIISYTLSCFCYIFLYNRNKIIYKNLKLVFKKVAFLEKQTIIMNSYKNYIFNIIVSVIQYLFGDSFLYKYYDLQEYKFRNKVIIVSGHIGLYYDPCSGSKICKRNFSCIYKGNFDFYINKNIKMFGHHQIKYNELYKYDVIATPIDQRSNNLPKVYFLNQEINFHNKLVKYSLLDNRDLYFYCVKINWNSLEVTLEKIDTENKNLKNIIQIMADKMTKMIFNNPEQYNWLHDRFK